MPPGQCWEFQFGISWDIPFPESKTHQDDIKPSFATLGRGTTQVVSRLPGKIPKIDGLLKVSPFRYSYLE